MATYTALKSVDGLGWGFPVTGLGGLLVFDGGASTGTRLIFDNGDGTRTAIYGHGLSMNHLGVVFWSSVSKIEHLDSADNVLERIAGLGADLSVPGNLADVPDAFFVLKGDDTVTGSSGNDILSGDGGNDVFLGGAGADSLYGGFGNDVFRYTSATQLAADEVIEGNGGVDTVRLEAFGDYDFRTAVIWWVEELAFMNGGNARFAGEQISQGLATVNGSAGNDRLYLQGNAISSIIWDYSALAFNNWSASDEIFITGHTVMGTRENDRIDVLGSLADNVIDGGSGNDTIVFDGSSTHAWITGGDGTDTVILNGPYLRARGLNGVESVEFGPGGAKFEIDVSGVTGLNSIVFKGGNGADILHFGPDYPPVLRDFSGLNLESWTEGIDFVEIYGGGGDDTFIGTDFGDLFWGNIANDEFDGRGGRDIALFNGGLTDYTITQNPDGSYVVNSWALNTHLVNIEVLRFLGDGTEFSLPIITSGGGGGNATYDISENTKSVTTVTAGPGVTYAIIGGADAAKFDIDAATGQLSLLAFPDFEHPADTGRDNSYVVKVRATGDGGITDDQTIRVNVLDVDEPTIIDSNGGGKRATINYQENGSGPVTFVHATDDDPGAIHYSIFSQNGGGAPIFQINSVSGELTFIAPPDFELSNPSHRYEVIVAALGGGGAGLTDYQTLTVRITDVDEAPSAPQLLGTSVEENSPGGTAVGTLSSVDPEGAVVSFTVSDSRFVVIGGVLTVAAGAVLDFETEPSINLTITARDPAGHETSRDLVISVTDGNEPPDIVFTPAGPDGVAEWTNFDRLAPSTGRGVLVGSIDMTDDGPSPTASQIHISDSRFRLTGSDGHYQLWAKLDFEQDPSTSVTVEFDGATKIIEVDVIDRDDLDVGSAGADVIYSGAMNDAAFGRGGADSLSGGAGDDVLLGGSGDDRLIGGVGDDVLLGGSGDDGLYGDDGDDVLQGGTGDDTLWGDEGDDLLLGGSGYDRLYGGTGIDVMKGGGGSDLYFVDDMLDEVIEFRRQGSYDHVETSVDYVLSRGSEIESLGTNDSWGLDGLSLTGNEIANAIFGNNGDNTLNGGGGLDVLWGFGGSDRFVFDTALLAGNICRIEDFSVADDTMVLDDAIFSGLTFDAGTGQLATGLLRIGGSAHDADDRIVYNAGTGKLYYDADGNGAVAAVQFAILATGLALTEADFLVF